MVYDKLYSLIDEIEQVNVVKRFDGNFESIFDKMKQLYTDTDDEEMKNIIKTACSETKKLKHGLDKLSFINIDPINNYMSKFGDKYIRFEEMDDYDLSPQVKEYKTVLLTKLNEALKE